MAFNLFCGALPDDPVIFEYYEHRDNASIPAFCPIKSAIDAANLKKMGFISAKEV
jgi:hypothetical protein